VSSFGTAAAPSFGDFSTVVVVVFDFGDTSDRRKLEREPVGFPVGVVAVLLLLLVRLPKGVRPGVISLFVFLELTRALG
jgi:hypothetical protein